jgi:hypothetical protein
LPDGESEIFFARGLDNPNHVESLEQIAVLAHAISEVSGPPSQATSRAIELILPVGQIGSASQAMCKICRASGLCPQLHSP